MSGAGMEIWATRRFAAPAERVFDAWLDPAQARRFLFATPAGEMIRAEIDPRVGGRFVFTDRRGDNEVEHVGEYLEIERPYRLAFRFGLPRFSADMTLVSVDIASLPSGCDLRLTQALDAKHADMADRTRSGWAMILEALASVLRTP